MDTIKVNWKDLEEFQKELVVALYNNSAFPVENREAQKRVKGGFAFWSSCHPIHPMVDNEDKAIWDATASVTKDGLFKLTGMTSSHGMGKAKSAVLPENLWIEIGSNIEATGYVDRTKSLSLHGPMEDFLEPCRSQKDWKPTEAEFNERFAWETKYKGKKVRVAYFAPNWASVGMGDREFSTETRTPSLKEQSGIAIARSKFFDPEKRFHARFSGPIHARFSGPKYYDAYHSANSLKEFLDQLLSISWKENISKDLFYILNRSA